jgi:predicted SnoaL-like aldol condensation-catalyzing enzyme
MVAPPSIQPPTLEELTVKSFLQVVSVAAVVIGIGSGQAVAGPLEEANKKLVSNAMHELFVTRDAEKAVRLYYGKSYLQHNPMMADGADDLPKVVASLPANFKYEPGIIVADGDMVMAHGRVTGWGPKPLVVVDIFRVKNGKLVEHWDVMQEEVPASQTKSGRPMFPIER